MRELARSAAFTVGLSLVLTSCGLAALSSPALAPESVVTRALEPAAPADVAPAPAVRAPEPILIQKAASEPAIVPKAAAAAADLGPAKHIWQTLNNCGPASVVMALSTFGVDADQETARLALRGPDVRRGMSPVGVDPWVRELYGLRAVWRNNGTRALIRSLISNGFAPMVTQWMEDPSVSRIAHWRTVVGYDDAQDVFYSNDPMRGRHVALTYEWFDRVWQPFSYRYLVIYRPEDERLVQTIIASDWSERGVRQSYYERAKREALERRDSASYLAYGEAAYQNGLFAEAVGAFEQGLALGSAEGVFTLRSSYPQALRALGREQEAARVQQLISGTPVPGTVAPAPDAFALRLAAERQRVDAFRLTE